MELGIFGRLVGGPPVLTRDDVRRIPVRPVMLRSGRFVFAMVLLGLQQKLRQSFHIQAESSSRKPRRYLLKQPSVAVRVAERSERAVASMIGRRAADTTARAIGMELSTRSPGVKHLTDIDTAGNNLVARSFDAGNN